EDVSALLTTTARPAEFHAGRIRDVSLGGLCLWTSRAWEVGTRLYLGIFWEGEPKPLVAVARVRRCVQEAEGCTLGLKFLFHTGQQRRAIERLGTYLRDRHGEAAATSRPAW
ncbi:MAG: PilZ domain-containing protein, partial [Planctomycetota bacterium]